MGGKIVEKIEFELDVHNIIFEMQNNLNELFEKSNELKLEYQKTQLKQNNKTIKHLTKRLNLLIKLTEEK